MNRRELLQSGLAALASMPFMGWVAKLWCPIAHADSVKLVASYAIGADGFNGFKQAITVDQFSDGTMSATFDGHRMWVIPNRPDDFGQGWRKFGWRDKEGNAASIHVKGLPDKLPGLFDQTIPWDEEAEQSIQVNYFSMQEPRDTPEGRRLAVRFEMTECLLHVPPNAIVHYHRGMGGPPEKVEYIA